MWRAHEDADLGSADQEASEIPVSTELIFHGEVIPTPGTQSFLKRAARRILWCRFSGSGDFIEERERYRGLYGIRLCFQPGRSLAVQSGRREKDHPPVLGSVARLLYRRRDDFPFS